METAAAAAAAAVARLPECGSTGGLLISGNVSFPITPILCYAACVTRCAPSMALFCWFIESSVIAGPSAQHANCRSTVV